MSEMKDAAYLQNTCAVYYTLGCKLNFAETAALEEKLAAVGVRKACPGEHADICIINTCSVTDVADHKCRQTIHKFVRAHSDAFVVVIGCYAQLQPEVVAQIEGVDLVLGMEQKGQVLDYLCEMFAARRRVASDAGPVSCHCAVAGPTRDIRTFVPSCSCGDRTRYFLKVQDGCDYYCTYCTIPYARGRSRNPSVASLVEQAEEVARRGGKEIVLTGVNIGDFGKTTGESFFELVRALDAVRGIERYRISSIEPNLLTDEIIDFCASSRSFMPHFHIPLQSGSDEVLRLMHRRYDTSFFARKIEKVRSVLPDAFIGVDVIVGTRGETAALFEDTYRFIRSLDISQLHVFSYSERPGTQALKIDHVVSPEDKHERSQRLLALSEQKRKAFYARFVGQVRPVLVEHAKPGTPLGGFTDNYVRVAFSTECSLSDNQLADVRLGGFSADESVLSARPVSD